jgi:hypothetical protein
MTWITIVVEFLRAAWKTWTETKEEGKKTSEQKAAENEKLANGVVDKAKEANKKELENIINKLKNR